MDEYWSLITKYPTYSVSNLGRIKSNFTNKILKGSLDKDGYIIIKLSRPYRVSERLHRLVAQTFLDNYGNLPQVNHKNGNKLDNSIYNLEWCTAKYNNCHAHKTGLMNVPKGEKHHKSKLTAKQVKNIRLYYEQLGYSQKELSKIYKVHQSVIGKIINNKIWKHL